MIDFVDHVLLSAHGSIFVHAVDEVGRLSEAFLRVAVGALDKVTALEAVGPSLRLVDAAGLVRDIMFMHEFEGEQVISSIASVVVSLEVAGQQVLGCQVDVCSDVPAFWKKSALEVASELKVGRRDAIRTLALVLKI